MTKKVNEILAERAGVIAEMRKMLDGAEAESRDLNAEEQGKYEAMEKNIGQLQARADRLKAQDGLEAGLDDFRNGGQMSPENVGEVGNSDPRAVQAYVNGFLNYTRMGKGGLMPEVRNALQVGADSEGGYIVPTEYETTLIEALQERNVMRGLANIITTASDRMLPVESALGTAAWTAEEGAYNESDAAFGQVSLSAYKLSRIIKVSEELLQDSFFDLQSYLNRNFSRSFGIAEEAAYVNGDGSAKPTGVVGGSTEGVTAAATGAITSDELIDLYHALGRAYRSNGTWMMNDGTAKLIRKLKDSNGQYVWQPGLQSGEPDRIMGRPVAIADAMPAVAASAKPVLFGDFSYYTIAQRSGISMQRLDELYAGTGQVGFRMHMRVDGKLTLAESVQHLVQAAT